MTKSQKGLEPPEWPCPSVCRQPVTLKAERARYSWAPRILPGTWNIQLLNDNFLKWKHSTRNCGKCSSPVSSLPSEQPPPSSGLQPAGCFSGALHPAMSYCPQSHQLFPTLLSWQQATAFSLQGDMAARAPCRQSLLPSALSLQGENAPLTVAASAQCQSRAGPHPEPASWQSISPNYTWLCTIPHRCSLKCALLLCWTTVWNQEYTGTHLIPWELNLASLDD